MDSPKAITEIKLSEAVKINLIIIGKSGCGKTTLFNVWKNPDFIPPMISAYSQTREPKPHHFTANISYNDGTHSALTLNILDTPGLSETGLVSTDERTDEEILKLVSTCLRENLIDINVIGFVFRCDVRISQEDLIIFEKIKNFLGEEWSEHCLLILTFADKRSDDGADKFMDQMKQGQRYKQILDYCKLGYVRTSAIDPEELKKYEKRERLLAEMKEFNSQLVNAMRIEALSKIAQVTKAKKVELLAQIQRDIAEEDNIKEQKNSQKIKRNLVI